MCHIQNAIAEERSGRPPYEFHFPRKRLRALPLVSATLEIEYAMQFLKILAMKMYGVALLSSCSLAPFPNSLGLGGNNDANEFTKCNLLREHYIRVSLNLIDSTLDKNRPKPKPIKIT